MSRRSNKLSGIVRRKIAAVGQEVLLVRGEKANKTPLQLSHLSQDSNPALSLFCPFTSLTRSPGPFLHSTSFSTSDNSVLAQPQQVTLLTPHMQKKKKNLLVSNEFNPTFSH